MNKQHAMQETLTDNDNDNMTNDNYNDKWQRQYDKWQRQLQYDKSQRRWQMTITMTKAMTKLLIPHTTGYRYLSSVILCFACTE